MTDAAEKEATRIREHLSREHVCRFIVETHHLGGASVWMYPRGRRSRQVAVIDKGGSLTHLETSIGAWL